MNSMFLLKNRKNINVFLIFGLLFSALPPQKKLLLCPTRGLQPPCPPLPAHMLMQTSATSLYYSQLLLHAYACVYVAWMYLMQQGHYADYFVCYMIQFVRW